MTTHSVASRSEGLGDEALTAATGRTWEAWFELLDAAGATEWKHPQIAAWLREAHAVPAWWCQTVTVGFEQARGMRLPGQRADGSFEVGASKTLAGEQPAVLDAVIATVTAAVGAQPVGQSREAVYPTARWNLGERESLLARANPTRNGKTSVSLTHSGIADADRVAGSKSAMLGWLADVVS
jgi:Domain of unknown function (DUF4287)